MPEDGPHRPGAAIQWDARRLEDPFEVLAGLFNAAMDAIIVVDSEQCVVLFNPAAERLFGYLAPDILGEALDRLIPAPLRKSHREYVEAFGRAGITRRSMGSPGMALTALRADGTEFPIEATIAQTESEGQRFYSVILRSRAARIANE